MNRKFAAAAAAVAGVLATAAPAGATTFCVPGFHAACPNNGTNIAQVNLETAMQAQGSDGVADSVLVAPGTYIDSGSFQPSGSDALTIRGAGPSSTYLTSNSNQNIATLNLAVNGNQRKIDVHDLTIDVPPSFQDLGGGAAQVSNDLLENVDIQVRNHLSNGITSWIGGGTFRGGRVHAYGGGSIADAFLIDSNAANVTIEDSSIEKADYAVVNAGATGTVTIRSTHFDRADYDSIYAKAGTTVVENSTFELTGEPALNAFAQTSADVSITGRHLTIVGDGTGIAFRSEVDSGATGDATLDVRSSIATNLATRYFRAAPVGAGSGDADLTVAYTNWESDPATSMGDGDLNVITGNTGADPQLNADLSIPPGSPAIDAGDPASPVTADILGALRPTDGDGVGGPRSDQGAFEAPGVPSVSGGVEVDVTAPDTVAGKGPKKRTTKRKATFSFSSEAGATFTCTLDRVIERECTSPTKVKGLKIGRHTLEVVAADAAGNVDQTPATFRFRVIRRR